MFITHQLLQLARFLGADAAIVSIKLSPAHANAQSNVQRSAHRGAQRDAHTEEVYAPRLEVASREKLPSTPLTFRDGEWQVLLLRAQVC